VEVSVGIIGDGIIAVGVGTAAMTCIKERRISQEKSR
jgi:hypothetical protein